MPPSVDHPDCHLHRSDLVVGAVSQCLDDPDKMRKDGDRTWTGNGIFRTPSFGRWQRAFHISSLHL